MRQLGRHGLAPRLDAGVRSRHEPATVVKYHRWTPRLILAVATAHIALAVATDAPRWRGMFSEGLWNTVGDDDPVRTTTMWFMLGGLAFFGLGLLTRRAVKTTGTVPRETAWTLLAVGVPISLLQPVSGGWSLLALAALALAASRHPGMAPEVRIRTDTEVIARCDEDLDARGRVR